MNGKNGDLQIDRLQTVDLRARLVRVVIGDDIQLAGVFPLQAAEADPERQAVFRVKIRQILQRPLLDRPGEFLRQRASRFPGRLILGQNDLISFVKDDHRSEFGMLRHVGGHRLYKAALVLSVLFAKQSGMVLNDRQMRIDLSDLIVFKFTAVKENHDGGDRYQYQHENDLNKGNNPLFHCESSGAGRDPTSRPVSIIPRRSAVRSWLSRWSAALSAPMCGGL